MRGWVLALVLIGAGPAAAQEPLFDADGYRAASYRAPVDRSPTPAQQIALPSARALRPGRDALFIDVLPAPPLGDTAGHATIPGAIWLPETGRSEANPALWAELRARVAQFRQRAPAAPVVLFCRADCWMSWNAARHLASEGVGGVYWLAEGIEGWREAGGVLVPVQPSTHSSRR